MDRGFGRCLVTKKFSTQIKRYANLSCDETRGPVAATNFREGENDSRYKKQEFLDADGICQVNDCVYIYSTFLILDFKL